MLAHSSILAVNANFRKVMRRKAVGDRQSLRWLVGKASNHKWLCVTSKGSGRAELSQQFRGRLSLIQPSMPAPNEVQGLSRSESCSAHSGEHELKKTLSCLLCFCPMKPPFMYCTIEIFLLGKGQIICPVIDTLSCWFFIFFMYFGSSTRWGK